MIEPSFMPLLWLLATSFIIYCAFDLILSKRIASKLSQYPIVGNPMGLVPRFVQNIHFAIDATNLLQRGYKNFHERTFQIIQGEDNVLVLPKSLTEELASLPSTIASPQGALEHDLLGRYTGLDTVLESRIHHSIVQRKLTPKLKTLTPALENEVTEAFNDYFPSCEEWTEIQPFKTLGKVTARLAARALVGPVISHSNAWLNISINYTESLFKTIVILRLFPSWTHRLLSVLLPPYWSCKRYLRLGKALLKPMFEELLQNGKEGVSTPVTESSDDHHVLAWLADTAKGKDRNADTLAHVEIILTLASVHTTLLRIVNVLYDLTEHPECVGQLQQEILAERNVDWNFSSFSRLQKLDSVLRESQRLSPPTITGMKRLFLQDHEFSEGTTIAKGTYVCMPTFAIENDPKHTENPEMFDGLRSYRLRQNPGESEEHQFALPEKTALNFGFGRFACPGRFFASLIIKMVMIKLLTQYEFKFLPGKRRPRNLISHEFLFPLPWVRILVRRRKI